MKDNIVKTTFRGTENLGNGLPIDYLSDHLDSFDITVRFVSGQGWLGIILFNGVEVFRSGDFKSDIRIYLKNMKEFNCNVLSLP
jgi:hypothetical protein